MKAEEIKQDLARKIIGRSGAGLYFLELNEKYGDDVAYMRSLQILLSYSVELIIKTILVLDNKNEEKEKILNSIKGHKLDRLFSKLSKSAIAEYGIKNIKKKERNGFISYTLVVNNSKVIVQDFVDIRYDFEKSNLRKISRSDTAVIKNNIATLLKIVTQLMKKLYP